MSIHGNPYARRATFDVVRRTFEPLEPPSRTRPRAIKCAALELADRIGSCQAAAYIYHVDPSTLSKWRRALVEAGLYPHTGGPVSRVP